MPEQDPTRHVLGSLRQVTRRDGSHGTEPVTFSDQTLHLRAVLAEGRADEAGIENDWHAGKVAFSKARALAIGALLADLAERVRPGTVTGPIEEGDGLADLAAELAQDLDRRRTSSPYDD